MSHLLRAQNLAAPAQRPTTGSGGGALPPHQLGRGAHVGGSSSSSPGSLKGAPIHRVPGTGPVSPSASRGRGLGLGASASASGVPGGPVRTSVHGSPSGPRGRGRGGEGAAPGGASAPGVPSRIPTIVPNLASAQTSQGQMQGQGQGQGQGMLHAAGALQTQSQSQQEVRTGSTSLQPAQPASHLQLCTAVHYFNTQPAPTFGTSQP